MTVAIFALGYLSGVATLGVLAFLALQFIKATLRGK